MIKFKIIELLHQHSGVDAEKAAWSLNYLANEIYWAGVSQGRPFTRPDEVEVELEALRVLLRKAAKRLGDLDPWTVSEVNFDDTGRRAETAAASSGKPLRECLEQEHSRPVSESLIPSTIDHLQRLDVGLQRTIRDLIQRGSSMHDGRGRKPNLLARRIALCGAKALRELTGQPPNAYRCEQLAKGLFDLFEVKDQARRACTWALSELKKDA